MEGNKQIRNNILYRAGIIMIAIIMLMTMCVFASSEVYAGSKAVTGSKWKKLTCGGLSKSQVTHVLDAMSIWGSKETYKQWNKRIKKDPCMKFYIFAGVAKSYPVSYKDNYSNAYQIKSANKVLRFYSDFQIKKNIRKYDEYGNLDCWTDNKKLYIVGGIGWESRAKITYARYNSKIMIIKYDRYFGGKKVGKYTATLKKLKSGKYKGKYKLIKWVRTKKYNPKY